MIKILAILVALVLFVPTIAVVGYKTVACMVSQGCDFSTALGCAWGEWTDTLAGLFGSEAKAEDFEKYICEEMVCTNL